MVAATDLDSAQKHLAAVDCDVVMATPDLALALAGMAGRPPIIALLPTRDPVLVNRLLDAGVDDLVLPPLDEPAIHLALHRTRPRLARMEPAPASTLVGDGAVMTKLRATIGTVAATKATVLITGETGTGKELVARAIHDASPRRAQRFVAINCAAIPAALLESELFGHARGAFTDAVRDKTGLFVEADHGTLFLDEVGELPLALQAKLLRVLQESEVRRVGDTESISIDVRLIAATLQNLAVEITAGRFREDLFYRLNVVPLEVPPLRERREDIAQLAQFFTARHAARHGRDVRLADEVVESLVAQTWPGNVRDLENTIERLVVLADGPLISQAFLESVTHIRSATGADEPDHRSRAIYQEGFTNSRAGSDPASARRDAREPYECGQAAGDQPPRAALQDEGVRHFLTYRSRRRPSQWGSER